MACQLTPEQQQAACNTFYLKSREKNNPPPTRPPSKGINAGSPTQESHTHTKTFGGQANHPMPPPCSSHAPRLRVKNSNKNRQIKHHCQLSNKILKNPCSQRCRVRSQTKEDAGGSRKSILKGHSAFCSA